MTWETLHHISGILADCTILVAALVAAIKLQVFSGLAHRWHSDLTCQHWRDGEDAYVLAAVFALHNRGQRSLRLEKVELQAVGVAVHKGVFARDPNRLLASHVIDPYREQPDPIKIHSDERMLFQFPCRLPSTERAVFVEAYFHFVGFKSGPERHRAFCCFLPDAPSAPSGSPAAPRAVATAPARPDDAVPS